MAWQCVCSTSLHLDNRPNRSAVNSHCNVRYHWSIKIKMAKGDVRYFISSSYPKYSKSYMWYAVALKTKQNTFNIHVNNLPTVSISAWDTVRTLKSPNTLHSIRVSTAVAFKLIMTWEPLDVTSLLTILVPSRLFSNKVNIDLVSSIVFVIPSPSAVHVMTWWESCKT